MSVAAKVRTAIFTPRKESEMPIKIFIDQGHNPQNPNAGAEGNGLAEQDVTYEIGRALAELLNGDPNYAAALSRNDPEQILGNSNASSLEARVRGAIDFGADYFISIHNNASTATSASGNEAYVYSKQSPAFELAKSIVKSVSDITGLPDRGVFARPTLYVLRKTPMPATLLEMGFITNPGDAAIMRDDPSLFARGIYNGIKEYFGT